MDESGHKREFMWGIENDYDTEDDDYCHYDSDDDDDDDDDDTVLAEKLAKYLETRYSKVNQLSSSERKSTNLKETDVNEMVHNCEVKQSIANDIGGAGVSNTVVAEKQIEEDASHCSKDNSSSSKERKLTDLQETDVDDVAHNSEIRQSIANDEDGGDSVNDAMLEEKQIEEDQSHYSEGKSDSDKSEFTYLQKTDMDEVVEKVRQRIANEGDYDINNAVLAEIQLEEDPSHYSVDNKSCSKESKFTNLQETDVVQNCGIRQSIANDDGDDTVNNAVLEENQIEEDQSHYSEDNKSDSEKSEFTCLQKTDMDEVVEKLRQRIANEDDYYINNAVLSEIQLEEDPSLCSEDNESCSKESKFTNLQETDVNGMVYNCEVKQSIANDISNTVVAEKQIEKDSSHYSKDNSSSSKERKLTDLQETDMVQNCEIRQSIANDDGGDSVNSAVLEEKQIEEDQSHYSEDKKSDCETSEFTYLQKTDVDEVVQQLRHRTANDGDDDDINNAEPAEKQLEENPSHYSEDNKSCSRESKFTNLQETDAESRNNCSYNVLGNSEVSAEHDAHVEDETAVRNFKSLRDMDMDNGLNVENILSCLKSLQCPFVWKPDKEVEMHPRGEIPINLAQHLTVAKSK
ncbi:protein PFC0760c-like [Schistocerca piceifrons]|uniref:protein PFC0760c-like n=1 Tax=Schistocerca piceifrons TaxID=274613 RepID=UPI001F5FD677|nr:protein PFC0760c-like [Schistocerca piceifrons]